MEFLKSGGCVAREIMFANAKRHNEKEHNMKTMQVAGRVMASNKIQICFQ
jgi:hypothetical protein